MTDRDIIVPVVMPKWGLSMTEGTIVAWLVGEGDQVEAGTEIMEVDTDKISGAIEAPATGTIRRIVAERGSRQRVKGLLAVIADPEVPDSEIDAFIAGFPEPEAAEEGEAAESAYSIVTVDGITVRYSRVGTGPGIVLIHGFGGDLDNWLFNIEALSEHGEVLALDLPGHGQSTLLVPDRSVEGLAGIVWSIMDELGMGDAALVGHSIGAAIVAKMASQRPEQTRALALVSPAGLGAEINREYLDGFVAARSKREMKAVVPLLFADPEAVSSSLIDGLLRYKRMDGVIPLLTELRDSWFPDGRQAFSILEDLQAVTVPVAVIWGMDDRIVPAAHAAAVQQRAAVHMIEGAGHMVQMEQANEVNRILVSHLEEAAVAT